MERTSHNNQEVISVCLPPSPLKKQTQKIYFDRRVKNFPKNLYYIFAVMQQKHKENEEEGKANERNFLWIFHTFSNFSLFSNEWKKYKKYFHLFSIFVGRKGNQIFFFGGNNINFNQHLYSCCSFANKFRETE